MTAWPPDPPERRRAERRDRLLLLAIALVARLAVLAWAWSRIPPAADGSYYHRIAERIATGHGYTWLWEDGSVTYAAHYPVGYPALVAPLYALAGPLPGLAMLLNAAFGALAAVAVHRLLTRHGPRSIALAGGLAVALHPGLVGYTPALMTEGVTAALVALAAGASVVARGRSARWWLLIGGLLGIATLVRPQCLLLAPAFALAAVPARSGWLRRGAAALVVTAITLALCLPWTLRNCARMGRCALVSVNGGWNLLIGTDPRGNGGWAPLETPPACREVFDEAAKDLCFERAAKKRIAAAPLAWASLAPAKLAVTFDYCGAPGWYLHEANPSAFSARAKVTAGIIETLYERALLLLALVACLPPRAARRSTRSRLRTTLIVAGAAASLTPWGWLAHLALAAALALSRPLRRPLVACALAALGTTIAVHAAFFGAGRYQLLVAPFVCALAAIGLARLGSLVSVHTRALRRRAPQTE